MAAIRLFAAFLVFAVAASDAASAEPCRSETFGSAAYTVCSFDPAKDTIRTFWRDAKGEPYNTFSALADTLSAGGTTIAFAMNGGMYGDDFRPVGLYVEEGKVLVPPNTTTVTGAPAQIPNFYKKPNGVFYVGEGTAGIVTTDAYVNAPPSARFATQSGPMLVIGGALHPALIEGSTDLKRRDGVGIGEGGRVDFVISDGAVNFYDFARFFRDALRCGDALFLDGGSAPGIYAPELDRNDAPGHGGYGPIIAVVK